MQFSTLALAALAGLVSAQKTTVVTVAMNGTLTFTPNNIKIAAGEFVQFQFAAGNHTVTQSNFDNPCSPISAHNASAVGFHSGYQPAGANATMIPTYTIQVNNTTPLWIYCAQGPHCQKGMSMVINENTAANATRSLTQYKALSVNTVSSVPGQAGTTTGTNGTTSGGNTGTGSGNTGTAGAGALSVPNTLGLLGLAAVAFLF